MLRQLVSCSWAFLIVLSCHILSHVPSAVITPQISTAEFFSSLNTNYTWIDTCLITGGNIADHQPLFLFPTSVLSVSCLKEWSDLSKLLSDTSEHEDSAVSPGNFFQCFTTPIIRRIIFIANNLLQFKYYCASCSLYCDHVAQTILFLFAAAFHGFQDSCLPSLFWAEPPQFCQSLYVGSWSLMIFLFRLFPTVHHQMSCHRMIQKKTL